jgi:lysophospholipase L1-like esterase
MKPAKRVFRCPPKATSLLLLLLGSASLLGVENLGPAATPTTVSPDLAKAQVRPGWLYARRKWDAEMAAFAKSDIEKGVKQGGILFLGSSSIRFWTTLTEDFPGQGVTNRGFGGSQIPDCVEYIDRLVTPHMPRQIVFYCGGNDLAAHHSPEAVAENFAVFVEEARRRVPGLRVAFISIAPNPARWAQAEWVREANRRIAAYCRGAEGVEFVDVFSAMLSADGRPRPELFREDGLHMNRAGYKLWARLVGPYLAHTEVSVR